MMLLRCVILPCGKGGCANHVLESELVHACMQHSGMQEIQYWSQSQVPCKAQSLRGKLVNVIPYGTYGLGVRLPLEDTRAEWLGCEATLGGHPGRMAWV